MTVVLLLLIAVVSYALGSVSALAVASRLVFRRPLRTREGSTLHRAFESFGFSGAAVAALVDIAKTAVAVLLGGLIFSAHDRVAGGLFAGFCVVLGHSFPVLNAFRGEKATLCLLTTLFLVEWKIGLCCLAAALIVLVFSRYVSLAAIAAAVLSPVFMWTFGEQSLYGLLALFSALTVLLRSIPDILRLVRGTEPRLDPASSRFRRSAEEDDEEL